MDLRAIELQRAMQAAVHKLHERADALVDHLDGMPRELDDDEQAALDGARRWRALVEGGEA